MAYQSEAALEQQFMEQLNKQEYSTVDISDYDALVENFKVQFEAFNAPKLDTPITDKEWERIFNLMLGKSVFQSAKILRDKFVLEREDGTKVYLSFFDQDHTKNIFQVTHQTTVVGKYVNRYDVTILVNGLPLIQVELKRRGIDIREAVNQVMRYKKHSYNGLYHFIQLFIVSNGVWKNVDREFLARRGIAYTHAYYEGVAHTILPLAAKFTKEYCRLTESCEEIIAEWMEMARDAYAHVTVKPGVRAYLKQCRAEGRRMAVVTSSVPEHCRTALTHLDLMKYFEGVTLAHDLGLEKKDPALWRAAAEHYGVAPEDCTVFDDSLSACKGARAAKMRVVGVYDGFFAQDEAAMRGFCDVYIRSFEELLLPPRQALRP